MGNGMDMRSLEHCLSDIMRGVNDGGPPDHLKGEFAIFNNTIVSRRSPCVEYETRLGYIVSPRTLCPPGKVHCRIKEVSFVRSAVASPRDEEILTLVDSDNRRTPVSDSVRMNIHTHARTHTPTQTTNDNFIVLVVVGYARGRRLSSCLAHFARHDTT